MSEKQQLIVNCPHCHMYVLIESINCGIFRHGQLKNDKLGTIELNPHESKEICELLISEDKIYGCGKPFRIYYKDSELIVEKCDYI